MHLIRMTIDKNHAKIKKKTMIKKIKKKLKLKKN